MTETQLIEQLISAVRALNTSSVLDVVIAIASPTLALAAICISIYTAHKQNAISLFEKRYEIYSKIHSLLKTGRDLEQNLVSSGKSSEEFSGPKHCALSPSQQLDLLSVQLFAAPQLLQRQQAPCSAAESGADTPLTRLDWFFRQLPLDRQIDWQTNQKEFFQQKESILVPDDILDVNTTGYPVASFLTSLQSVNRLADQIPLLFPDLSPEQVETLQSTFDTYARSLLGTYDVYSRALPNTRKREEPLPQGSSLLELYAPHAALPLKGTDVTPEEKAALFANVMRRLADQTPPLFSTLSPEQEAALQSVFDAYAIELRKYYAPYTVSSSKTPGACAAAPKAPADLLADAMQRLADQVPPLSCPLSREQAELLQNAFNSYALSLLDLHAPGAALSLKTPERRTTLLTDVMQRLAACRQDAEMLEESVKNLDLTLNDFIGQCRIFEKDCMPIMRDILSPSSSRLKRTTKKIRQLF